MGRARWASMICSFIAAMALAAMTWSDVLAQTPLPTPRPGSGTMGGGIAASTTGDPILAAIGVIALGSAAAVVTAAALRLRRRPDA